MLAKGKHRRSKAQRIARTLAVAGTGGAAIALPLIGAAGAQAAPNTAHEGAVKTVESIAAKHAAPASAQQSQQKAETKTYSVVSGDYLSKIADKQDVSGGWNALYENNRSVIGSNPDLILPGMKLSLDGEAKAAPAPKPAAPQSSAPEADTEAAPQAQPKAQSESQAPVEKPAAPAEKPAAPAEKPAAPVEEKPAATGSDFVKPVDAQTTTSYRASGGSWSSGYHTGVDFAVGTGTSVKAIGQGTVVSAGNGGSYGNEVVIKHEDGRYSQYAHLSSLSVSAGQSVSAGTQIGLSGSTGNSTGPHLHFEVRTGPDYGSDIDPLAYLRGHGVSI